MDDEDTNMQDICSRSCTVGKVNKSTLIFLFIYSRCIQYMFVDVYGVQCMTRGNQSRRTIGAAVGSDGIPFNVLCLKKQLNTQKAYNTEKQAYEKIRLAFQGKFFATWRIFAKTKIAMPNIFLSRLDF